MQKPSIPKGTRDFAPSEMMRRNYIFDTVKDVFRRFGFAPIETPAMENLSTLLGKYGEEGDKLMFRILNSGDFTQGVELSAANPAKLSTQLCEKGLRYDLTVPFARFVVQHQGEIALPFRRYQIQPVWRADRPQKGRYREFYQCDVDIVGSDALLNEAELMQIIDEVFRKLKIRVAIKLNNRKILSGIAEMIGQADKITDITVAIDKMEKIGEEKVREELLEKGLSQQAVDALKPILELSGSNADKLASLRTLLADSAVGLSGIDEVEKVLEYTQSLLLSCPVHLDLTLARGLNYYTGAIVEVKALDAEMGSICGGGRYDNLTGIFGLPGISGVGVSFGADRIYDVLTQLNAFPNDSMQTTKALFLNFGAEEELYTLHILQTVRRAGVNAEIYPEAAKIKKQMAYANSKAIPYVVMAGKDEIATGSVSLKDMTTGEQKIMPAGDLTEVLM